MQTGRAVEAELIYREVLADREKTKLYLANLLLKTGRAEEAEPIYREVLRESTKHYLANLLLKTRRAEEAEPIYREVLADREGTLGAKHLQTLKIKHCLANLLRQTSRWGPAPADRGR